MKKVFKRAVLFTAIFILAASCAISAPPDNPKKNKAAPKDDIYNQLETFSDVVSLIRTDYVDTVESKKIVYGALRGMLGSLDDFSSFMDPDEYRDMLVETKGEFGGLGIEISMRDGILTIITPIAGTPAEAAGLKPGDKIVKIDDKITKKMSITDAIKMMKGDPGTQITLTVWRESAGKIIPVTIKRAIIKITSIKKAALLEDKVGYIKLIEFQENTPRDLEDALKKLEKDGMNALILDLRNNPGGLLDVAIDVSEKFLPKDAVIVSIKSRVASQNAVFKSSGKFTHPDYPIIVLVNEGSASASEIVSGAIQDDKRGLVLGTKTYGKASVQTVIPIRDGSAVRLTTAQYLTPSGTIIRDHGIIPDVLVEREEISGKSEAEEPDEIFEKLNESKEPAARKEEKAPAQRDNQLDFAVKLMKAIKVLKGKQV